MKNKIILLLVCLTFVLYGCSKKADVAEDEVITWRIGHEEIKGAVMDEIAVKFKEEVEKNSDGKIQVEIYRSGEIGAVSHYMEFLQDGLLNFSLINPGTSAVVVPENNMFYNHFILPAADDDIRLALNNSKAIDPLLLFFC